MKNHLRSIFFILFLINLFPLNSKCINNSIDLSIPNAQTLKIDSNITIIKKNQGAKNDSFLILAKHTLKIAKENDYQTGVNQCLFQIARIYDIRNNSDSAELFYNLGLEQNIPDKDLYADFLLYLADLQRVTGNLSSSLEKSLTLKSLVESKQTSRYTYQVYNLLGLSYLSLMEYDAAFENFNKSAEMAINKNNEAYAGVVYSNIGHLFYKKYKLNEALEYFEKGIPLEEKYNLLSSSGNSYNIMADIYLKLNNESKVWEYLNKAKKNNLKSNNRIGLSKTFFEYGELYFKKNNIDSAIFYLNKSIEIASKHSANSMLKDAYYSLSKVYSKKKDFEKAYYYYDLFFTIHNSIYNVNNISKAKALEQELIQKEKESEIIALELKKQETINKLQNIIIGLGFAGVIVVLIYLFQFKKLNKKLVESKNKAEESDKLKSKFLQTISHEIRTPLNGIIGFSEMLINEKMNQADLMQINDMILKNSNDLVSTIENLVDIAHLTTNQYNIKKSKFELNPLLESIINQTKNNVVFNNKKDIDIHLIKNGEVELYSDKSIILKIILHLVKNAIMYTEKGSITLGYMVEESNIVLYVKDTGIGIPQEKIDIIFAPFRQADTDMNIKMGGTGLGLTIVNDLVHILDGKIWVGSELKKGSIFSVSLPIN